MIKFYIFFMCQTKYIILIMNAKPTARLLVAFATIFYQAAIIYDSSSLVYYATSAMAALCIGILMRKNGELCWKRLGKAIACYFVCATLIATLLTIWRTSGVPDSGWERSFFETALGWGLPAPLACLYGTAILKFFDSLLLLVVLPILHTGTPKKYRTITLPQIVSWKHPYFHSKTEE